MQQNDSSTVRDRTPNVFTGPMAQAVLTGALTLIPARNYPNWLRKSLVWGPTVVGVAGATYFAAKPEARTKVAERSPSAEQSASSAQSVQSSEPGSTESSTVRRATTMITAGGAVGATLSLVMAGGFWADEKIERGLRRIKIPLPRVVMGAAAGVATWYQAKQDAARDA